MKRRLLIIDAGKNTYHLSTLHVESLVHDEREDYFTLHGEALCQYILRRDPTSLIVARGPLAFMAGNKATVGYLSPLTGVPHYSFVGGQAAAQLFALGLDAIVLTGETDDDHYLVVSGRAPTISVRFVPTHDLPTGQRAAFYHLVRQELGGDAGRGSVFALGEGAQYGYRSANLGVDGIYHAGRGGAGIAFARFARGMVLRGPPPNRARFFATLNADHTFARNPNRAMMERLNLYTARLSGTTGGTIVKLYATGNCDRDDRTLPAYNARQLGYELADLGSQRMLSATRDGHTGCQWCPVDCRHWHWVEADYAPGGRDRFLDDFEPAYAIFAMLGLQAADDSLAARIGLWKEVNHRLFLPLEQLGCDVIDIGVGLAALFEGLMRGIIPPQDVPIEFGDLADDPRARLEAAAQAIDHLRRGVDGERYPALRAIGDGPQALADLYPPMQNLLFTCGPGTLGNAGHCNALWTFLMPFSRFFGHYSGQIYKIDEPLPSNPDDESLRRTFQRVIARMLDREFFWILGNALSCCAFTFVVFSQDGQGERLSEDDLLVHTLAEYGIRTTREDLEWFAQAFWAQSIALKAKHGWRPPTARDFPARVYEALSSVLHRSPEELSRWMDILIAEWREQAAQVLTRFGYDPLTILDKQEASRQ